MNHKVSSFIIFLFQIFFSPSLYDNLISTEGKKAKREKRQQVTCPLLSFILFMNFRGGSETVFGFCSCLLFVVRETNTSKNFFIFFLKRRFFLWWWWIFFFFFFGVRWRWICVCLDAFHLIYIGFWLLYHNLFLQFGSILILPNWFSLFLYNSL